MIWNSVSNLVLAPCDPLLWKILATPLLIEGITLQTLKSLWSEVITGRFGSLGDIIKEKIGNQKYEWAHTFFAKYGGLKPSSHKKYI